MCGRFSLTASRADLEAQFGVIVEVDFPPRYNISPTQPVMIILAGETPPPGSNRPDRIAMLVRWGFVPGWVKDPNDFPLMINARSETAADKPSFRTAMQHRRALLPVSGFYEWRKLDNNQKQAYWIRPRDGSLIALGALMETWTSGDGSQMDTMAILTTDSNDALRLVHNRLPLVIHPQNYTEWLDCKANRAKDVKHLLRLVQEDFFEAIPVSDKINNAGYFGADVQERVDETKVLSVPSKKKKLKKAVMPKKPDDQFSLF